MGLLDLLRMPDINAKVAEARENGATIVDVRSLAEYSAGHVPGAECVPLENLPGTAKRLKDRGKLYVYCASGSRSAQAVRFLKSQGLAAENIGGIFSWKGDVER